MYGIQIIVDVFHTRRDYGLDHIDNHGVDHGVTTVMTTALTTVMVTVLTMVMATVTSTVMIMVTERYMCHVFCTVRRLNFFFLRHHFDSIVTRLVFGEEGLILLTKKINMVSMLLKKA